MRTNHGRDMSKPNGRTNYVLAVVCGIVLAALLIWASRPAEASAARITVGQAYLTAMDRLEGECERRNRRSEVAGLAQSRLVSCRVLRRTARRVNRSRVVFTGVYRYKMTTPSADAVWFPAPCWSPPDGYFGWALYRVRHSIDVHGSRREQTAHLVGLWCRRVRSGNES